MTVTEVLLPRRDDAHQPWELVGRDQELAVIRALVDGLAAHGRALLLSCEPGLGKSALLDVAEETAATAGIRVLRAAGAECEDVSFGGLNQLLLPLRGDLGALDERQRDALNVALGFSDGPAGDRLVVSNAVLALLLRAAADAPLLLIVDDLHWVDRASAQVLGFVARRLRGSRLGLIAAERTTASDLPARDLPHDLDLLGHLGLPGHEVGPLDDEAAALLVATRFPAVAAAVRQRIVTEARGNVLALLELTAALTDQQRAAVAALPAVLPLTARLAAQLRDQPQRRAWHLAGDVGQARRLATAAYLAASVIGDLAAAEALLADARRACPGEMSAEIAFATAFVLLHGDGDVTAAHQLLLRGLETVGDGGTGPLGGEQALELLATVGRLSGRAEHWEALPEGRPALRLAARADSAGRAGLPALQAGILLALEAYQTGQWDEAWRLAESAADRCASGGWQLLRRQAQTVLALVAAGRGDAAGAQALADEVARWAAPRGLTSLLAGAHYAGALAALGQSDFQTAYQQAARIGVAVDIAARAPGAAWALLDLVEAALRTDRGDDAIAHVEAIRQAGLAAVSPRMALLCTAAMAMTAPDQEAPALFDRALATEGTGRWPFDRARVQLLYGERLRRGRAVSASRVHLSAALDEFRRLGAPTWADRAAVALRATGQVRQHPGRRDYQELTPQELEIARLAAAGLSNKQIGERLYMSHRTVGSHLYRIFPKLGVTSRAALSGALPRAAG
jgi:DNA-binding CsgD family transcriptional regulator